MPCNQNHPKKAERPFLLSKYMMDPLVYSSNFYIPEITVDETIASNIEYVSYRKELGELRFKLRNLDGLIMGCDVWKSTTDVTQFALFKNVNYYRNFVYEFQQHYIVQLIFNVRETMKVTQGESALCYYSESPMKTIFDELSSTYLVVKQVLSTTQLYVDNMLSNHDQFTGDDIEFYKKYSNTVKHWPNLLKRINAYSNPHSQVQTYSFNSLSDAKAFYSFLESSADGLTKFEGYGQTNLTLREPS